MSRRIQALGDLKTVVRREQKQAYVVASQKMLQTIQTVLRTRKIPDVCGRYESPFLLMP